MMRDKVQKTLASLALLLGIAHIGFGLFVFKTLNLEVFWFLGFGLAIIVTALANFSPQNHVALKIQNGLMLLFISALLFMAPQPQVLLGCILFAGLLVLSFYRETVKV